jgi:hypothetical protein
MRPPPWDAIVWWEVRRVPFNLALLASGLITVAVALGTGFFLPALILGVAAYAAAANLLYTLGWISELLWSGGDTARTAPFRRRVFRLGLIGSVILTLLPAVLIALVWATLRVAH